MNNGQEVTVAELKEAGYTVEFKYNKTGTAYNKTTGVVDGRIAKSPFKYQVVVTPAEGEAIESNWADVTVLSATTAVEVTEVALSNELTYVTLGETVTIDVKKAVNAFGDELAAANLPAIASVVSSDPTIAYVTGTNTIQPRKEGSVTFTVKFAEALNLDPVTLTVEVKAAQKATAIKAENVKVEADATYAYSYDVLDQYGEVMRSAVNTVEVVTNSKGEKVEAPAAFATEDTYTVIVYLEDTTKEDNLGTKLGSFTVTTVNVADSEVDEFKLTTAKGFEIDINPDLVDENNNSIDKSKGSIAVEAYIDGVKISDVDSKLDVNKENPDLDFKLRTSDKSVLVFADDSEEIDAKASNTVKGLKAGTATVSLVKVEGDLETVVATYVVEVKNTVKVITTVNFEEGVEAVTVTGTTEADLIKAVADATDLDEKHIEKVEYAAADEVVIITLKATYGGEEFVLAAKEESEEPTPGGDDDQTPGGDDDQTPGEGDDQTPAVNEPTAIEVDSETGVVTLTFTSAVNVQELEIKVGDNVGKVEAVENEETKVTLTFETGDEASEPVVVAADTILNIGGVEYKVVEEETGGTLSLVKVVDPTPEV